MPGFGNLALQHCVQSPLAFDTAVIETNPIGSGIATPEPTTHSLSRRHRLAEPVDGGLDAALAVGDVQRHQGGLHDAQGA